MVSKKSKNEKKVFNIGLPVSSPKEKCSDPNCPFHGKLPVRGRIFVGKVKSSKMDKTVVVTWERREYIPKYERYLEKRSHINAHNPLCINAVEGDTVRVVECRPLSKTKSFVVVEVIKK